MFRKLGLCRANRRKDVASSRGLLTVGTPPNAIVFGTGLIRLPQMMKAGFWLNLAGILVITALVTLFIVPLLGKV
jgi:solute carrier family 13 (sodium-dependent dicarboxylate transporter), member 2/3/5